MCSDTYELCWQNGTFPGFRNGLGMSRDFFSNATFIKTILWCFSPQIVSIITEYRLLHYGKMESKTERMWKNYLSQRLVAPDNI